MMTYRALWLGGVCLGLSALPAAAGGRTDVTAQLERPFVVAENEADKPAEPAADETKPAEAQPVEAAPAAAEAEQPQSSGPAGDTQYYGASEQASTPAWAAEATMNPDYNPESAASAPDAAPDAAPPAQAASEEPPPQSGPPGETQYYGTSEGAGTAPWSAEATMNPDYKAEPAAPAEAAPATTTSSEPALPSGPPGDTQFYGDTRPAGTPAWAADAKMNPDYNAKPAAASPATQQAVEACRDALNAEVKTGSILFAMSKWDVLPESYRTLNKIARIAKDCSANFVIEIGGHTDNTGKAESNVTISELRAKSVLSYLETAGVPASKLKAVGYGQDKPVADNATAKGRAQNRRIEFLVTEN